MSSLLARVRNLETPREGDIDLGNLKKHLQIALELELSTLPPYMCALYSIQDGANIEAAGLIRSVLMEEMLHVTLVANVLNAIGGEPVLVRRGGILPSYPTALPDSDKSFVISLQKFSREAIASFLQIERPAPARAPEQADRYHTIGQFYKAIDDALKNLSNKRKGAIRFDWNPKWQVHPEDFYNSHGKLIVVNSLETAREALKEICNQGEGIDHKIFEKKGPVDVIGYELAHYFRFMEIAEGRRYNPDDTPKTGPQGDLLPVDWTAVHKMVPNPKAGWFAADSPVRRQMDECNAIFYDLLQALQEGFRGNKDRLREAVPLMLELKQRAISLMKIPSGIADTTLGPSFEWPEVTLPR